MAARNLRYYGMKWKRSLGTCCVGHYMLRKILDVACCILHLMYLQFRCLLLSAWSATWRILNSTKDLYQLYEKIHCNLHASALALISSTIWKMLCRQILLNWMFNLKSNISMVALSSYYSRIWHLQCASAEMGWILCWQMWWRGCLERIQRKYLYCWRRLWIKSAYRNLALSANGSYNRMEAIVQYDMFIITQVGLLMEAKRVLVIFSCFGMGRMTLCANARYVMSLRKQFCHICLARVSI